jgi:hypothetical protein
MVAGPAWKQVVAYERKERELDSSYRSNHFGRKDLLAYAPVL